MKWLLFVITTLFFGSCYSQKMTIENEQILICTAIQDYTKTVDTAKQILLLTKFIESANNRRLLFEYLDQNNISHKKEEVLEFKAYKITENDCFPKQLQFVRDQNIFDSLSTAFRLPFELENNILFQEDTSLNKTIPPIIKNWEPISVGKPWRYKEYAVISIHVLSQPYVYAYKFINNKWQNLGMVYDPK